MTSYDQSHSAKKKKKIVMINLTSFSLHTSHNSQQQFPVQQIDEFIHVMQCKAGQMLHKILLKNMVPLTNFDHQVH